MKVKSHPLKQKTLHSVSFLDRGQVCEISLSTFITLELKKDVIICQIRFFIVFIIYNPTSFFISIFFNESKAYIL